MTYAVNSEHTFELHSIATRRGLTVPKKSAECIRIEDRSNLFSSWSIYYKLWKEPKVDASSEYCFNLISKLFRKLKCYLLSVARILFMVNFLISLYVALSNSQNMFAFSHYKIWYVFARWWCSRIYHMNLWILQNDHYIMLLTWI